MADNWRMGFSTERKGASQNIAFIAISCALIASFSLLAEFFPLSSLFIILFIPPISALAVEYSERKYAWLFLVCALSISIAVTANNYIETLFYVFPGIISGFFYGYLRKTPLPLELVVFLSALLSMGLNYLSLPLIKGIFDIDMIEFTLQLLHLNETPNISYIVPCFIFSLSLAELAIAHLLIELINLRLGYKRASSEKLIICYPLFSLLSGALSIASAYFYAPLGYVMLIVSFYFALSSDIALLLRAPKAYWIILSLVLIASVFLFSLFYKKMPSDTGFLLLSIFFVGNDFVAMGRGIQLSSERKRNGKDTEKQ